MWLRTKVTFKNDDVYGGLCIGMINTNNIIAIKNYSSKPLDLDGLSHRYYVDDRLFAVTNNGTYELTDYSLEDYDKLLAILNRE